MEKVENGLYVSVDYKGTLQNGEIFDSSQDGQPLEVQMGVGQLIEGFERELMGMSLNDKKEFTLEPEDAYGQRDNNLTRDFARSDELRDAIEAQGYAVQDTPEGMKVFKP